MSTTSTGLRANVVAARRQLAENREKLQRRHERGAPGVQVCRAYTELFDQVLLELFDAALADLDPGGARGLRGELALVAHGGYGRADVAPDSDVDLMILYEPKRLSHVAPLAERMVRDVFDVGLTLGQSVRTINDACKLASEDAQVCTSLIESRLLTGNERLYSRFARKFQNLVHRRATRLIGAIELARGQERQQFGETAYLLEPNVKRSPGGLRDLQLLRWVGFARFGVAAPDELRLRGELERSEFEHLRTAYEFLLRLRNEMHFHAGKSNDVLDRVEQLRLAEVLGFRGTEGLLPVEEFMREYFRLTGGVSSIVSRFVQRAQMPARWTEFFAPLISHQFEGDFRVEPHQISANRRALAKLRTDLAQVLRLADVANLYDKPIAPATWEAIHSAAPDLPAVITPEVSSRFISLLSQSARLGPLLRKLHEVGILEKIIPQFAHVRGLLQFNLYHQFTVDEHTLRTVSEVCNFRHDNGPLGSVYRHLKRKWLLHLALLLHDLGKGYSEDHSDVGLRIAAETAVRLDLSDRDTETLKFLVHKHLLMSHLAFWRDTSDNRLVVNFAVEVGSAEVLEMLYVMTAADLAAVGPGVLNAWKIEVLSDLFHRAIRHFGGADPSLDQQARLQVRREEVLQRLVEADDRDWWLKQLAALPAGYLDSTPPERVVEQLRQLRELGPRQAISTGHFQPESSTVEFRIGTYESIAPGVFHKLTGALASQGLQVLSAEINTLADGLIFDRFVVADPDYAGEPPPERLLAVNRALVASLETGDCRPPSFRRVWRAADKRRQQVLNHLPTQVRMDNDTSESCTIIDVFAADRMGLLYTIARTLFESGLSISFAKIGTYLDQVVDVFYVTDQSGHKLVHESRLSEIRTRLLAAIDELQRQDTEPSIAGSK